MALADDINRLEAFIASGGQRFEYDGTTYTLTGARKLLKQLKTQQTEQREQAESEQISTDARLRKAQKAVTDAETAVMVETRAFAKGNASEQDVRKAQIRLQTAKETLARLTPSKPVTARPSQTTQPVVTPKPADGSAERAEAARLAGLQPPKGGVGGAGGGVGAGGGGVGGGKKPDEVAVPAAPETGNILDELAQQFPAYRDWTLEQATGYFGADLIQVFNDVAAGKYGRGKDKDRDAIKRAISGTQYWLTTENSIRTWDGLELTAQAKLVQEQKRQLAQTFGELALDDATLTELATTIQRTGLKDLGATQLVYGTAFARPRTETGPQPRQLALESSLADEIRRIGKSYNYAPRDLDAQIEAILTGKPYAQTGQVLTKDAFRQKAEKLARGSFGHLKDQFDSGLTLEDIFGNYRELASRVLEIDPNSIDFVKDPDKWLPAFGNAQSGQMSLSDWVTKLKSDEKYNWQFTNQARQQATNLVMEMEKAFGFRK